MTPLGEGFLGLPGRAQLTAYPFFSVALVLQANHSGTFILWH